MSVPRKFYYVGNKTTAQLAKTPVEFNRTGNIGYDTTLDTLVYYDGAAWSPIVPLGP